MTNPTATINSAIKILERRLSTETIQETFNTALNDNNTKAHVSVGDIAKMFGADIAVHFAMSIPSKMNNLTKVQTVVTSIAKNLPSHPESAKVIEAIGTDISPDDLHEMAFPLCDSENWTLGAAFWCAMCTIEIKRGKTIWVSPDFQCLVYDLNENQDSDFATSRIIEQFPCLILG